MRVMDFIRQKYDSMNETDFLKTVDALADQYADALRVMPGADLDGIPGQVLLAGFLLQEIAEAENGYRFLRDPGKSVLLRELRKGYRERNA